MSDTFTLRDAGNFAEIMLAAQSNAKVARVRREDGHVTLGQARCFSGPDGQPTDWNKDVRNLYLMVTTSTGFEEFWSVNDLMPDVYENYFVRDYQGTPVCEHCQPVTRVI